MSISTSNKRQLSIQIGLNGFSFCIRSQNSILELREVPLTSIRTPQQLLLNLKNELAKGGYQNKSYDKVVVIYDNELYTFVPTTLFSNDNLSSYLKFNLKTLPTDYVAYDQINKRDLTNVYIPYTNITNHIFDQFGSFDFFHITSLLTEYILDYQGKRKKVNSTDDIAKKRYNSNIVVAHLDSQWFHVVIVKEGKLELCNTFSFESTNDIIYYLLFTIEQLQLDRSTLSLRLLGQAKNFQEYIDILQTYIADVDLLLPIEKLGLEVPNNYSYQKDFIASHLFLTHEPN